MAQQNPGVRSKCCVGCNRDWQYIFCSDLVLFDTMTGTEYQLMATLKTNFVEGRNVPSDGRK